MVIIYFTEDKKNYQIIKPKMDGDNKFNGEVSKLVEHITHSNFSDGRRNYHSYVVI